MRLPPNLRYLIFFLLLIALIVIGTIFLPRLIPGIGKVLTAVVVIGMILLIIFSFVKPMFTFLFARADGVFAVYIDQNEKGFHVFSYHINPSPEFGSSMRDIQHYFIVLKNGKVFYKCIFSHPMEPQSGRSGWEGFDSFEESVLPSPRLVKTLDTLSRKAGMPLQLGKRIQQDSDDHFAFEIDGRHIELKKYNSAADEGVKVICVEKSSGKQAWVRKI